MSKHASQKNKVIFFLVKTNTEQERKTAIQQRRTAGTCAVTEWRLGSVRTKRSATVMLRYSYKLQHDRRQTTKYQNNTNKKRIELRQQKRKNKKRTGYPTYSAPPKKMIHEEQNERQQNRKTHAHTHTHMGTANEKKKKNSGANTRRARVAYAD